jgi:hypothetical protein
MHQVSKAARGAENRFETTLTDEPIQLSGADRTFITNRFIKTLSGRGIPIIEDASIASPVPSNIRGSWMPNSNLVSLSKQMATHLAEVQPASALECLLVIATATLGGDELLLLAKIEHQEAMRLEPSTNASGNAIFSVERLTDLVFGDTSRIYKIAVMFRSQSAPGPLAGEIVDEQNGMGFATYFIGTFMGMRLREEPAVLTERFLETMNRAINRSTLSPEARLGAQSSLISEIASNRPNIEPERFIREYIPVGNGSEIKQLASDEGAPLVNFRKDTQRIKSRIGRMRLDMSNGVHVVAPPEAVGDGKDVSILQTEDGDVITITGGRLENIKSSGGR